MQLFIVIIEKYISTLVDVATSTRENIFSMVTREIKNPPNINRNKYPLYIINYCKLLRLPYFL